MSTKFLGFFREGRLSDGRKVIRGTLGSIRVAMYQDPDYEGRWTFIAEHHKGTHQGHRVEMLDGGCTLHKPRWPRGGKPVTDAA